jgi:16S rRNA (cytidine1402-2'-O)-methyltransferase
VNVLKSVDAILAEDTRTSGFLLKHLQISKPLHSYHIFNEHQTVQRVIAQLKAGKTLALVSDAGTPAISDPGFCSCASASKTRFRSSVCPARRPLSRRWSTQVCPPTGLRSRGFCPTKKAARPGSPNLVEEARTMVFYESPHRLVKSLTQFAEVFGPDRQASVSRELTKLFEETVRGSLQEIITYFAEKTIKGEIVIVVQGK